MAIASSVRQYLDAQHAQFDVLEHAPTMTAMQSAEVCHIPAGQLAKAVLLDIADDHLLAVLPADHRIQLADLRSELGERPRLSTEREVEGIFDDCAMGAVPPLGSIYGVELIIDDRLREQPDIYFEAGDPRSLIHMDRAEFSRLTGDARHGRFSEHWADRWPPMA